MIIKINQTNGNINQEFDIYHDGEFAYSGTLNKWHTSLGFHAHKNGKILGRGIYKHTHLSNYFPLFKVLFGESVVKRCYDVTVNGKRASFSYKKTKLGGAFISIECGGEAFRAFAVDKGDFGYLSIYTTKRGEISEQIALIETFLTSTDQKFNHKLYLLDEYSALADIFFNVCPLLCKL